MLLHSSDVLALALEEEAAENALSARLVDECQAIRGELHLVDRVEGGHDAINNGERTLHQDCHGPNVSDRPIG